MFHHQSVHSILRVMSHRERTGQKQASALLLLGTGEGVRDSLASVAESFLGLAEDALALVLG